ncbi:PREDICTED: uncharacterized protein LOC105448182 [Wasmannia auropunctata]|uniref:uncharacterized protein LOC105448182 n=1 Tax=Wasmannia auropunctata TaxID=64793 RepID=UPI0005EF3CBB|nr:PREDICTED: uncharacterized protein LOC105448182 [Wasmannia auropunctata]
MFDEIRYELDGVEIDRCRNVGITSTLKHYVTTSSDRSVILRNAGWDPLTSNEGFFNFCVPLYALLGFCEDYKRVVLNARHELILIRSRNDNNCLTGNQALEPSIELSKIQWRMPHVLLNEINKLSMLRALEKYDEDVTCDDESDNDHVICEDYFDSFDSPNLNDNTNDNIIMFEAAGLSICQVFTMVQALTLRYHHSDESRHALLNLIKSLAGPKFSYINTSKYMMSKLYNPPANKILYVFYCIECYIPLLNPLSKNRVGQKKTVMCGLIRG